MATSLEGKTRRRYGRQWKRAMRFDKDLMGVMEDWESPIEDLSPEMAEKVIERAHRNYVREMAFYFGVPQDVLASHHTGDLDAVKKEINLLRSRGPRLHPEDQHNLEESLRCHCGPTVRSSIASILEHQH